MLARRLGVLALLVSAALLVTGCGGDDGDAEDWAGSVCSEVNEWVADIDSTVQSLTDDGLDLDEADIREAADSVREATDELAADLEELEPPETENAQEAEEELETLREELRSQLDVIDRALTGSGEPLRTVARVATALASAADQLEASYANLERLDPGGELEEAFRSSDDCEELREQIAEISS